MPDSSIRILIVSMNYEPEVTGIAPYVKSLVQKLQESNRVHVMTTHPHYPTWKIFPGYKGLTMKSSEQNLRVTRLRHYIPNPPIGIRRLLSELSFSLRVFLGRTSHPKLAVLLSPSLLSSATLLVKLKIFSPKTKAIIWVQDIYTLGLVETAQGNSLTRILFKYLEKWTMLNSSHIVVIHDRFQRYIQNEFGISPEKISQIPNWNHVSIALSETRIDRDYFGWSKDKIVVLHTGNMGTKQGLANVVLAARMAEERGLPIHFVLMGNGGEFANLTKLSEGLSNLEFLESVSDELYPQVLKLSDILLVSQIKGVSDMAVPSKLTSYFQSGKPVVASVDKNGITALEIVSANAGVIVDPENPEELLKSIGQLYSKPDQMRYYGVQAKEYAERNMSEEVSLSKWSQVILGQLK